MNNGQQTHDPRLFAPQLGRGELLQQVPPLPGQPEAHETIKRKGTEVLQRRGLQKGLPKDSLTVQKGLLFSKVYHKEKEEQERSKTPESCREK